VRDSARLVLVESVLFDAQFAHFCFVIVDYPTLVEPIGCAGDISEGGSEQSAGTRLSGSNAPAPLPESPAQPRGERGSLFDHICSLASSFLILSQAPNRVFLPILEVKLVEFELKLNRFHKIED
jgi:hypothetical protein